MRYLLILFLMLISCSKTLQDQESLIINLEKVIPEELSITSFIKSDLESFYEVELSDGTFFYYSNDGEHLFLGDLFRIEKDNLLNLSYAREKEKVLSVLSDLDKNSAIKFSSQDKKHEVFIFTDVDCGYCRKFHSQIQSYLDLGIEVNYLSFPREGLNSKTAKKLVTAWCSDDKQVAITELKNGKELPFQNCDSNPIEEHYNLARRIGITGTPTIITKAGISIPGLMEANELMEYLK